MILRTKVFISLLGCMFSLSICAQSEAFVNKEDSLLHTTEKKDTLMIQAGFFDRDALGSIDYSEFRLPPLGTLFENAKSTPSIELLEKERKLAEKLVAKEKRAFLNYFNFHANYSYGNTTSTATSTDITTPLYTFSNGTESHYWNIGASINVGLESLLDLGGRIKRSRIVAEQAAIQKEIAFDKLKQEIATIYVRITNNLIALKTAAENAAAYRGAGLMSERQFLNNQMSIQQVAEVRRWENSAVQSYQTIQSQISTDIILLEIITHTPIITNVITGIQLEDGKKR